MVVSSAEADGFVVIVVVTHALLSTRSLYALKGTLYTVPEATCLEAPEGLAQAKHPRSPLTPWALCHMQNRNDLCASSM